MAAEFFKFDAPDEDHQTFNKNAIAEIQKRKQPNDFLLAFWGYGHFDICMGHQDMICVEPGIGYAPNASFCKWRIYESYALLHASNSELCKVSWYHAVIPNYFDPEEFEYEPEKKEDYFLFALDCEYGDFVPPRLDHTRVPRGCDTQSPPLEYCGERTLEVGCTP